MARRAKVYQPENFIWTISFLKNGVADEIVFENNSSGYANAIMMADKIIGPNWELVGYKRTKVGA